MKHPVNQRHHGYGAEWLQSLFTMAVLLFLYQYSLTFDSNAPIVPSSESVKKQTSSYWNDSIGYWFRWDDNDTYTRRDGNAPDIVSVSSQRSSLLWSWGVRVSFYTDLPIENIEKLHTDTLARAYSRLPNGIAVIEWDLSSSRAKNVLATLHAR